MINRILIVNAGPIYPVKSMGQMRTHNMIRTLSKDFIVDLLTPCTDDESIQTSHKALHETGGIFIPLRSVKHKGNIFKKRSAQVFEYLKYYLFGIDKEVTANKWNNREIIRTIIEKDYKIVISNYWEASLYFAELDEGVYKILDPHYSVGENFDVLERIKDKKFKYFLEKRRLIRNSKFEKKVIDTSDLLLPLSKRNFEEFKKVNIEKPMLIVPDGADLDYYLEYPSHPDPKSILFYGAMGSAQNKRAFWRFYNNILPKFKKEFPDIKLLVVGSRPPGNIKALHDGKSIIVTGFVEDVRYWLSQAWLKIIPLELGSGFRGRVIELMAMGIPVVGTHNALDSIDLENGISGFISDSDKDLTEFCLDLLRNPELRNSISRSAKEFVTKNYSLESTFGKLNQFLKSRLLNESN